MKEIWVDIKGYEGKYQLSNTAKVKSLNYCNTGKEKLLKIRPDHYGHNMVTLSKNNKRKFYLMITLVAEHFLIKPAPDMIPIHIGDIDDDSVENITYGYRSEMLHLMYKKGHRKIGKPSKNIISYKNKPYRCFSDMAKDYDITTKLLDKRINRGWTLEEALEIPIKRKELILNKKMYKYKDKMYSVAELSRISGINKQTIYKRLKLGWCMDEVMEIPVGKNREE